MLGGSGSISSSKTVADNTVSPGGLYISLAPNAGYFFANRLAGGLRTFYSLYRTPGFMESKSFQLGVGPFVRYYFLKSDKKINILGDAAHQFLHSWSKQPGQPTSYNTISVSGGPVFFLDPAVGLELTGKYDLGLYESNVRGKTLSFNIGFQIHFANKRNRS